MEFGLTGEPGYFEESVGRWRRIDINTKSFVPSAEWKSVAIDCGEYTSWHAAWLTDAVFVQSTMAPAQDREVRLYKLIEQYYEAFADVVADHTLDLSAVLVEDFFSFRWLCL